MHLRRVITGLAILPVFLLCVFWDYGHWFSAGTAAFFFMVARAELYAIQDTPSPKGLAAWQNLLAVLFMICTARHDLAALLWIGFLFYWGSCLITLRHSIRDCRKAIAAHGLALVYLLIPLDCYVYLRSLDSGPAYLGFMLTVACITDTGALYGGSLFGRHKLAPVISPNKTWEGAVCGALSAIVVLGLVAVIQSTAYGYTFWWAKPHQYLPFATVTLILSIVGQIGDLFESALKRDARIKDSGSTITGHGGYLDMMDSMLWIGPAMVVYVIGFIR